MSMLLLVLALLLLLGGIIVCWLAVHPLVTINDRIVPTDTGDVIVHHTFILAKVEPPLILGFLLVEVILIGSACWLLFRKRARRTSAD
jgi:hypothetical protein